VRTFSRTSRRLAAFGLGLQASLGSNAAGAQPTQPTPADAYCDYLEHTAAAERAQLKLPELTARTGLVQGGSGQTGDSGVARETAARTSLGIRYSLNDLWRAGRITKASDAECRRRLADATLVDALEQGGRVGLAAGLRARADELTEGVAEAERLLERARRARAEELITDRRLVALRLRVEGLREDLAETRARWRALDPEVVSLPPEPLVALLAASRRAASEQTRRQLDARLSRWWDIELSGGYDQLFGIEQSLPVYATIQLSLDVGRLAEGAARPRATEAYDRYRSADGEGFEARIQKLRRELEARRDRSKTRLRDVEALLADLTERLEALEGLDTAVARDYASDLVLRRARLNAERAELAAALEALDPYLGAAFAKPTGAEVVPEAANEPMHPSPSVRVKDPISGARGATEAGIAPKHDAPNP